MSDLVGNKEDLLSHDAAHLSFFIPSYSISSLHYDCLFSAPLQLPEDNAATRTSAGCPGVLSTVCVGYYLRETGLLNYKG